MKTFEIEFWPEPSKNWPSVADSWAVRVETVDAEDEVAVVAELQRANRLLEFARFTKDGKVVLLPNNGVRSIREL